MSIQQVAEHMKIKSRQSLSPDRQPSHLIEVKEKKKKFSLGMAIMEQLKKAKFGKSSTTNEHGPSH